MSNFEAAFIIIEERHCPLYSNHEGFILRDNTVELSHGRPVCLILLRELTKLLVTLLPYSKTGFAEYSNTVFNCGGCSGLIKFRLVDPEKIGSLLSNNHMHQVPEEGNAVMSGSIDAVLPAELLQIFHMHQKTGRLIMDFGANSGRVTFREGGVLAARFGDLDNQAAIHAMLAEKRGTFRFIPGLPEVLMQARELGDFMMILMAGLRQLDEDESEEA